MQMDMSDPLTRFLTMREATCARALCALLQLDAMITGCAMLLRRRLRGKVGGQGILDREFWPLDVVPSAPLRDFPSFCELGSFSRGPVGHNDNL